MSNLKKAFYLILLFLLVNTGISILFMSSRGNAHFIGYLTGTALSFVLSFAWLMGARIGLKKNALVLLGITLGGFPIRLTILAVFAFGGLYLFNMNIMYFAIAFLVGTIYSLIIEVWFLNTVSVPGRKKLQ